MKLLLNERKLVIGIGNDIEYGVWGNIGDIASWRINPNSYAMDSNCELLDIGDMEIPTYVQEGKYYFINDEFKLADECPNEYKDRIVVLEDTVEVAVDELMNTQLALADQYESNIVFEEDLLNTQLALADQYEMNGILEEDLLNAQLALAEQYEINMVLEETVLTMQEELVALRVLVESLVTTE